MTWVEETKDSYEFEQRQNVVLDDYGVSFVINTGIWQVSLDYLNTLIIDEIGKKISDVLGPDHLHAIIEQVHIVIKTVVKFTLICLHHDGHIYLLIQNFIQHFCILLERF